MHSIQILSLSLLSLLHPIVRTADIGVRMSTNATSPWCNPTREHKTPTSAHTRDGLASDGVNKHQVCRDDDNHNNENANAGMENGMTRGGAHHVEWRCRVWVCTPAEAEEEACTGGGRGDLAQPCRKCPDGAQGGAASAARRP